MENIFGPYDGFYVAVSITDTGSGDHRFLAEYKICKTEPADYSSADFLRSKCVEGFSGTEDEARELALQLAQLQIAGWRRRRSRSESLAARMPVLADTIPTLRSYEPTVPCPL